MTTEGGDVRRNGLLAPAPAGRFGAPLAMGTQDSITAGAAARSFSLASLLVCAGCEALLQPSWSARNERVYLFLCGCQQTEIDAAAVELSVWQRVVAASVVLVEGVPADQLGPVFSGLFAEVRVAASADELAFVWRVGAV